MSKIGQEPDTVAGNEWRWAAVPFRLSRAAWILIAIIVVAVALRSFQIGRLSFWYDEVVTMRLARSAGPRALCERLFQIDATRAPLHPLVLQQWIRVFGASEAGARALSVVCGAGTILLVFAIGRTALDTGTGIWAAWLAAWSPLLVVYDREARMYAWLVMLTCLAWYLLFSLRRRFSLMRAVAYVIDLAALCYSHPLGILMVATVALAALVDFRGSFGTAKRWLLCHCIAALLVLPWIKNYLDHPPEFVTGRLPLRFLLGTPIGFIGGNSWVLLGLCGLVAFGIVRRERAVVAALLLTWLSLPPVALYLYSWLVHPIFGPARYTVFVAPAFLLLVAAGLNRMPVTARYPLAAIIAAISALTLYPVAFDPNLKADWRGLAHDLAQAAAAGPERSVVVIVASEGAENNVEVETARYYLPATCTVLASEDATAAQLDRTPANAVYYAIGWKPGRPTAGKAPRSIGTHEFVEFKRYPGLIVYRGLRSPRS
jgi:mannosyltransferase